MPSCVVKDCSNHSRKTKKSQGVTFHRFLRPGHEKREAWIQFVQKNRNEETWLPNQHAYICSLHFKEQDKYNTKLGRVYLKKCAVPHDYNNVTQSQSIAGSDSEIGDVNISDSDSVFDSPRKVKLKSQLRHKQMLCDRYVRRIKTLQQQNRRLAKRNKSLKIMLRNLKHSGGLRIVHVLKKI